jgi:hypothetical protein
LYKNESELKICRDLITEFETLSKYNNITNFEVDYKKYIQDVNQHQEHSNQIEDKDYFAQLTFFEIIVLTYLQSGLSVLDVDSHLEYTLKPD